MELDLQGWKVKLALAALVVVVIAAPFVRSSRANKDRAEDWRRRALVAEEAVTGLRVVIVDRSRELNRRTVQANQLASLVDVNGTALRRSKISIGTLAKRQRSLAEQNTRIAGERGKLQVRVVALERMGSTLSACTKDLAALGSAGGKSQRTTAATAKAAQSRAAACKRASASFDTYLEQAR